MRRWALSVVLGVGLLLLSVALAAHGARPVGAASLPGVGTPGLSPSVLIEALVGVVVGVGCCALVGAARVGGVKGR